MLSKIRSLLREKKGQGLAEYGLIVAGVIVMALAAVSIYGHKTSDMWALGASLLPGAHADDLGAITSGKLIATTGSGTTADPIEVNANTVTAGTGNNLGTSLGIGATLIEDIVVEGS